MSDEFCIAVVIPCFKVRKQILAVLDRIGSEVTYIFVVDDCCPEKSGAYVEERCKDTRVKVLYNATNLGVGGAVIHGYREALRYNDIDIIVKIDGDGQMDPSLVPNLVEPIKREIADYVKGNRFYNLENIKRMPKIRIFGNTTLSFFSKLSTGYWQLFDPNNGFTAIRSDVLREINLNTIDNGYFFETDMLFRLNTIRANVIDMPMDAVYEDEKSNIKLWRTAASFFCKHSCNTVKRIFYNYYLRDVSLASIELPLGLFFFCSGLICFDAEVTDCDPMITSFFKIVIGLQLLLGFFSYDIASTPHKAFQSFVKKKKSKDQQKKSC